MKEEKLSLWLNGGFQDPMVGKGRALNVSEWMGSSGSSKHVGERERWDGPMRRPLSRLRPMAMRCSLSGYAFNLHCSPMCHLS